MDRLASDRFVSLFVGMDRPWKLEDGNQFIALDVGELLDMAILDSKFTMILEPSLQEKYFKDADGNPEVCGTSDWCGFSKNKAFSPAKAMLDQSLLWDRYYRTFTDMTEAPSSADPSIIVFNLKLKMDVFCNDQHARAVSDLRSK
jgi:hypothetical protein